MESPAELDFVVVVGVDPRGTSGGAFAAVADANPVGQAFDLHLLPELMSVPQAQIDAAFVVRHVPELHVADPFTDGMDWKR